MSIDKIMVRGGYFMLQSVEGIYRDGVVELLEAAPKGSMGRVLITFLDTKSISLSQRGIDEQHAADLRHRLQPFHEDWARSEMDVYDAS
jgi:hypothetical protein